METLYESKRLYKKDTMGRIRVWYGEAFEDVGCAWYKTISGVLTGKQKSHTTEAKATAKYSANEAAVAKIENAERDKRKKGYFETQEEAEAYEPRKLMLLHKYPESADRLDFPILVQLKLDGICAGYMDDPEDPHFKSREDNRFEKLDSMAQDIKLWLDAHHGVDRTRMDAHGELYVHGTTVSELVEGLKGDNPKVLEAIEFYAFDFMTEDAGSLWYVNRLKQGMDYYGTKEQEKPFRLVKTRVARDSAEVELHYRNAIQQGYEGLVLCNRNGTYEYERRTYDKLKYKQVHSEEFEIIGYDVERNGEQELIMFQCKTKEGATFKVRPKWDHERREAALQQQINGSIQYIGEMATVEYRSLTAYKTPFHGVLISTRNYE